MVIVIALFIVALVATMAYVMLARLERDTRRTTLLIRNLQAEYYAQGSIAWAKDQLSNNWEKQKPNTVIDKMPMQSPANEVNGYKIVSTIYDMQARFNLNNLTNAKAQEDFQKLLQLVEPKLSAENAKAIVLATVDWISPTGQQNQYSKYYMDLPLPYRAAHRAMVTPSELRLVKGMAPTIYVALQPYITALPTATQINVQTASAPVLATLSPTMHIDAGRSIEQIRAQNIPPTTQAFLDLDVVKNNQVQGDKITVTSNYFLVETDVTIEKQHVVLYTLLERATKDKKAKINILWQSKGVW